MPLFEYRCRACDHLEEVLQKHGEGPPAQCPQCKKKGTLEKALSLPSFQLKGGGWYKDLYASQKPGATASDSGDSSDRSSSKGEATSPKPSADAKPKAEPKAESKAEKKADKKADKKSSGGSSSAGGAGGSSSSSGSSGGGSSASAPT